MDNLRISTMVAICNICKEINLQNLYEVLNINDIIKYAERDINNYKGYSKKNDIKKRKNTKKNCFFNQITLHIFNEKIVNVKIFNNGKIHMTGIKSKEQGQKTIEIMLEIFKEKNKENKFYDEINDKLELNNYEIVMINSDFDIKYKVNRELLHRHVINCGIYSSYEPIMYPGVNIKYYFNTNNNNGICCCNKKCKGKGTANGDGECKRITIAVFSSGKIIITGGKTFEQIETGYNFIYNILKNKEKYLIND